MAGERSARRRMATFVIAIFLAACALGAVYLFGMHPRRDHGGSGSLVDAMMDSNKEAATAA